MNFISAAVFERRKPVLSWCLFGSCILAAGSCFLYDQSNRLQLTRLRIPCPVQTPLRLIHLSDLHAKAFGKENRRLIHLVAAQRPDLICITGDLVNRNLTGNMGAVFSLIEALAKLCPVAVSFGNHEVDGGQLECLEQQLKKLGAMVLVNQMASLTIKKQPVFLLGLQERWQPASLAAGLAEQLGQAPGLRILLSHYPHFFSQSPYDYREYPIHLMLAGHAHGGQVRLPFVGAVFCPGQGFFPRYVQGCYDENGCVMIVSRGLGRFPRVLNQPEVIVAELTPQRKEPDGD